MNSVFITGKMRSGTTFLCNLLNSQHHVVVYSDFLRSIFNNGKDLDIRDMNKPLGPKEKNILVSSLEAECFNFDIELNINAGKFNTVNELFVQCLHELSKLDESENVNLVGIKKTEELYYLEQLLINNHKVIYIYRDPRDVLLSSENRFAKFEIRRYIRDMTESLNLAIELSNQYSNFYFLKYEDLILQKDEICKELTEFLGTNITPDLEQLIIRDGKKYTNNSSFGDVSKLFDSSAVYRWKNADSKLIPVANYKLKKHIKLLGYEEGNLGMSWTNIKFNVSYNLFLLREKILKGLRKIA